MGAAIQLVLMGGAPAERAAVASAAVARGIIVTDDAAVPAVVVAFGAAAVREGRAIHTDALLHLAAIRSVADADSCLEAGADDVLLLPADEAILAMRMQVLARRAHQLARRRADMDMDDDLRAALASFPDLIVRLDAAGTVLGFRSSPHYRAVVTAEEVLGSHFIDLVGDRDGKLRDALARCVTEQKYVVVEHQAEVRGELRWYEGRFFPARDGHVVLLIRNITEQMRAQADLANSQAEVRSATERLELIERATTDAVWDWDIGAGRLRWNDRFHQLFGHPRSPLVESVEWWAERIHGGDRARVSGALLAAIEGDAVFWSDEYRFERADGRYAVVADRGYLLRDAQGRATRMLGAMVDVTETRELSARLLLADRLASLGTLAAGVAHEINNPLTHVIMSVDHAERALAPRTDVPRAAIDALGDARRGAERVRSIVRDLRTFARAEVDRPKPVDVRDAIAWATRIVEPAIRSKARLVTLYEDAPRVMGDESRLSQVFVNLLVNAAQAIGEGGPAANEVKVRVSRADGERVRIEVSDTGSGIPANLLGRIFDPFFTTKEVGEGTGLGLSIVHGILTSMGGSIEVDSTPGTGTTFRVYLPATDAKQPVAKEEVLSVGLGRPGKVLVIDDDALTRTLIERTLRAEHDVTSVAGAKEALQLFQTGQRFDVVFSDLMMPEMTGMDFHAALTRMEPALADRVVFLTAGAFTNRAQRFLEEVSNACLEKPFDPEALLAFTRERVRRSA